MATSRARRSFVGLAAMAAAAGLAAGNGGLASAHTITTSFNTACVATVAGLAQHQVQGSAVTVADSGPGKYTVQFAPTSTPGSTSTYTMVNISDIKTAFSAEGITAATVIPGTGYGYAGTPSANVVSSTRAELAGGLTVPANTTFQLPTIEITASGPVKLDTTGVAAQYNNAQNYLTFNTNAKVASIAVSAATRCIPADGPLGSSDIGNYPTLNAGAGALHA